MSCMITSYCVKSVGSTMKVVYTQHRHPWGTLLSVCTVLCLLPSVVVKPNNVVSLPLISLCSSLRSSSLSLWQVAFSEGKDQYFRQFAEQLISIQRGVLSIDTS